MFFLSLILLLCFYESTSTSQDDALCGLIAASDIASQSGYSMWQCTTDGLTSTDPCTEDWEDTDCDGGFVDEITLSNAKFSGITGHIS